MKVELDVIEQLARAATPGTWSTTRPNREIDRYNGPLGGPLSDIGVVAVCMTMAGTVYAQPPGGQRPLADAQYIAAVSPEVVLELLAMLRSAEADALTWYKAGADGIDAALENGVAHTAILERQLAVAVDYVEKLKNLKARIA